MAADWVKIRTEYITTDTTYRELAQKYGLHYTNIAKKASKENWQQLRQQQATRTQTKLIEAVERKKVDRAARLMTVADKLLDRVEELIDEGGHMSAGSIKNLSDALKGIKESQMLKSPEDIQEQRERIEKMRRENDQDKAQGIAIEIRGWEDAWKK